MELKCLVLRNNIPSDLDRVQVISTCIQEDYILGYRAIYNDMLQQTNIDDYCDVHNMGKQVYDGYHTVYGMDYKKSLNDVKKPHCRLVDTTTEEIIVAELHIPSVFDIKELVRKLSDLYDKNDLDIELNKYSTELKDLEVSRA